MDKNLIAIEDTPSYGVIWWVLVRIKPEALRQLLHEWLAILPKGLQDQVLAIDGKCLRGTNDTLNVPLHLVSLFAIQSGILLARQPVDDKSNEITAIPKILDQLDIRGAVITIDAMGCQKSIARQICEGGADYILSLKGNAGGIYNEIVHYFKEAEEAGHEYLEHTFSVEQDLKHGRTVKRTVRCVQDVEWLPQLEQWEGLKGIIEVVSERTENGMMTTERRYYITSLDMHAQGLGKIIRGHWGIENNLHRQLDVNFNEDDSVVNIGYAAENLAIFRRLALNILGSGKGLLARRKQAAWNEDYLTEIIRKFFIKFL